MEVAGNLSFHQSVVVLMEICFHRNLIADRFVTIRRAISIFIHQPGYFRALTEYGETRSGKQTHRFVQSMGKPLPVSVLLGPYIPPSGTDVKSAILRIIQPRNFTYYASRSWQRLNRVRGIREHTQL